VRSNGGKAAGFCYLLPQSSAVENGAEEGDAELEL
jgi:hypothetical protein